MSWSAEVWASIVCRKDEADRLAGVVKGPIHGDRHRADARWKEHGRLDPTAREVLDAIASLENPEKGYAWPSVRAIAREIGRSPDTVQRHLHELRRRDLVEVRLAEEQEKPGNRVRGHCYRVNVPKVLRDKDKGWTKAVDQQTWNRLARPDGRTYDERGYRLFN